MVHLNHGSYGACPTPVLEHQHALRMLMEREPVEFLMRGLQGRLDAARTSLAPVVGADPCDLVFVENATSAVNSVLRSFPFEPGSEVITTDHAYESVRNSLDVLVERGRLTLRVAEVPFPCTDATQVTNAVCAEFSERTSLVVVDHVSSATAPQAEGFGS